MSDGYRNGAFALGVVVGAGSVLLLVVFAAHQTIISEQSISQATGVNTEEAVNLWNGYWGQFVTPSASLAQWLSVIVSAVGTVVLLATLRYSIKASLAAIKAADAALSANELMRDDQRAWITIEEFPRTSPKIIDWCEDALDDTATLAVRNRGRASARNLTATFLFYSVDTVGSNEAAEFAERELEASLGDGFQSDYSNVPGEDSYVEVSPLPGASMFLGDGTDWRLLVICFYTTQGERRTKWQTFGGAGAFNLKKIELAARFGQN